VSRSVSNRRNRFPAPTSPSRNRRTPPELAHLVGTGATSATALVQRNVSLTQWARHHAESLRDKPLTQRIGVDRRVFVRDGNTAPLGDPVDFGPACIALLQAGRASGDEASACLGRLLLQAVPRFQISDENSTQWGAFTTHLDLDPDGCPMPGTTAVDVRTHARTTSALFAAQQLWPSETRQRSALAAARWLILRQDPDGLPSREHFDTLGNQDGDCSPWTALEAARALSAAHRHSRIPVFQTTARRAVETVAAGLDSGRWDLSCPSPLAIGDAVEALLEFAAVSDHARWNRLACSIAERVCRIDSRDFDWQHHAGATAAWIATARIHDPIGRLGNALGHLKALTTLTSMPETPANHARVVQLTESFFLRLAGSVPDSNICSTTRTVQLQGCRFEADPAASEHVHVESNDGQPLETRLWACSKTFRVFGVALLPDGGSTVRVLRRGRVVAARCLRTHNVLPAVPAAPFSESGTATFAIFTTV
jgi:hypothetical protein